MTVQKAPADWKNYDDFAFGIDTNRLPLTTALNGTSHQITFKDGRVLELDGDVNEGRDIGIVEIHLL